MAEFEDALLVEDGEQPPALSSDFNDFEEEQVAELEDTDDWGE
jgi:hypothetical protein